jgi:hypothetical protein
MAATRPPSRLLVSNEVGDAVDMALIDVSHELRRRVSKTEFNDALATIGLRHLDEIKTLISAPVLPDAPPEVDLDD